MDILIFIFSLLIKITRIFGIKAEVFGKILLKIYPSAFNKFSKSYRIVLIEGTNGKSTTAKILKSILSCDSIKACIADEQLNTKEAVAAFLAEHYKRYSVAVFSSDFENLSDLFNYIVPEIIAVTNLYSDATDLPKHTDKAKDLLAEGCRKADKASLILNGDTTVLWDFLPGYEKTYYGINEIPSTLSKSGELCCPSCQTAIPADDFIYTCPVCGVKRPLLDVFISKIFEITHNFSRICFNDGIQVSLPLSGIYNIYNAVCATACAKKLGVSKHGIEEALSSLPKNIDGTESVIIDGVELIMMPIKNAAGANESLQSVIPDREPSNLAFILNDDERDGIDVSWIYNVKFEDAKDMNYNNVLIAGKRRYDMAIRLKCAGLNTSAFSVCADYEALLYDIKMHCHDRVYLFTTYSGLLEFRRFLRKKGV